MSHELEEIDGKVEMAYLEDEGLAWHGLGQPMKRNSSRELWLQSTNMGNWTIKSAPVLFYDEETEEVHSYGKNKVLFRSDTKTPLSTVGVNYKPVQPAEVIEFFSDIIESMGFEMSTAGVLFGGKKFWAQANCNESLNIMGKDMIGKKLLLSTACDGSLATTACYTAVRTVCNNTLQLALNGSIERVKVSHSSVFNPEEVKTKLGLADQSFKEFGELAERMADRHILEHDALDYIARVFDIYTSEDKKEDMDTRLQIAADNKTAMTCYNLFTGEGLGSELVTAKGTLWGAFNSITDFVDNKRNTRTWDSRFDSAQFGAFNNLKIKAWDEAILMVA